MATKTKTKSKSKRKKKKKLTARQRGLIIFAVCMLIVFAIAVGAIASKSTSSTLIDLDKDVAYGIDVSHHNGKINWKTVKNEVDFAFIRVGYRGYTDGAVHLDKRAISNLKNANKNSVPIGVYFYSQAINEKEAEEEAQFVLNEIKNYDISLPVVIDFEYAEENGRNVGRLSDAQLSKKEITSLVNAFCSKVEKAGYTPAVYASSYIFRSHLSVKKLSESTMIWVADYNKKVTYSGEYDFWQFSKEGKCKGVSSKYVDTNYWYTKTEEQD